MKKTIAALAVAVASALSSARADAQVVVEPGPLGRTLTVGGACIPDPVPSWW
jgi:hypothetical protein